MANSGTGSIYSKGLGVQTNHVEAAKWLRKAADQNEPKAQAAVVLCYLAGRGVPADGAEAYKWCLLASDHGEAMSKVFLATMEKLLSAEQTSEGRRRAEDWRERWRKASAENATSRRPVPEATQTTLRALTILPKVDVSITINTADVEHPERAFSRAELLLQAETLRKELAQDLSDAERHWQLGILLEAAGRSEEAKAARLQSAEKFAARAKAHPSDGPLQVKFAWALAGIQKTNEAEQTLRTAVKAVPKSWACWSGLGEFLERKGYLPLLALSTNTPPRAATPEQLKQMEAWQDEADRCFERAATLAPEEPAAVLAQALHQTRASQRPLFRLWAIHRQATPQEQIESMSSRAVCAAWAKAARLNPINSSVIGVWGYLEAMPGIMVASMRTNLVDDLPEDRRTNVVEAVHLLELLAHDSNRRVAAGALETLGILQFMVNRNPAAARPLFRQSVALDPTRVKSWDGLFLASFMASGEKCEEVVPVCQDRLKYDDTALSHILLAKAYNGANHPTEALEQARAAVSIDDSEPVGHLCAGALLLQDSHAAAAKAEIKEHLAKAANLIAAMPDSAQKKELYVALQVNGAIFTALEGYFADARQCLRAVAPLAAGDEKLIKDLEEIAAIIETSQ